MCAAFPGWADGCQCLAADYLYLRQRAEFQRPKKPIPGRSDKALLPQAEESI